MADDGDFCSVLHGGNFTFLVGPDKVKFEVHAKVISRESKVLDKLMDNDQIIKPVERSAELPSVEPDTFASFAHFCHYNDYTPRPPKRKISGEMDKTVGTFPGTDRTITQIIREIMREKNDDKFCCTRCGSPSTVSRSIFPHCSPHCFNEIFLNPHCVNCGWGTQRDMIDLLCGKCLPRFSCKWTRSCVPDLLEAASLNLTRLQLDQIMHDRPAVHKQVEYFRARTWTHPTSENVFHHLKVFFFAEAYEIPALGDLSTAKLISDIESFFPTDKSCESVVDILQYVYKNTHASDESVQAVGHTDLLRRVALWLAAKHIKSLMTSEKCVKLIREGGEMAVDLMQMVASQHLR